MLQNLRPPSRVLAGMEPLAQLEAEAFEHADDPREESPRAAEGVVVVVRPAEAEAILAHLLRPGRPIAALPVVALDLEDDVTGQVAPDLLDDPIQDHLGHVEPLLVVVEPPPP